jgi:fatty-acyl-CoA synthase
VTSVGGIVALLNTNLGGAALAHCINIAAPEHVIVAADLLSTVANARPYFAKPAKIWVHGGEHSAFLRIDTEVNRQSGGRLSSAESRPVNIEDRALYIYTSGTTGLPKAANISHHRLLQWSFWFGGMMDTQPSDRMYDCLPMYHSVGGIVAIGALLVNGGSIVIREKFSATQFWSDVTRWDCSLFQYIGELCRYLVHAEPDPHEREHRIRLSCGNGLRADVWTDFKNRFNVPQILEFYASTEGNFSLYNVEGEPGAIGRIPSFLAHRPPTALIELDIDMGEPVRDAQGFCIRCSANQVGEAIGQIPSAAATFGGRFDGYTNEQDSQKKILRNVFARGDAWFRTGDLMRRDERGFFYFVDRIGDTFRWKGENVATTEVSEAITEYPGIPEANVYGVEVPGTDGRACMAAVVVDDRFNLAEFRAHITARLPNYACPVFLRICREMEVTPTFKHKKRDLAQAGYDPSVTTDKIFLNDWERGAFVPVDTALYQRLRSGRVRM